MSLLHRRHRLVLDIIDEKFHLGNFAPLGLNDSVSQFSDAWIRDLRALACKNGNRMEGVLSFV
jgi:hypothetical protein